MTPRKGESIEDFKARRSAADAARRSTAEGIQRNRENVRDWTLGNRDRKSKTNAAWRLKNADRMRALRAEWKEKNKDRLKVHKQTRRARAVSSGGVLSSGIVASLMGLQRCKCANCGASLKEAHHLDHIEPLARGGRNEDGNVQLLCPTCNWKKNALDPFEWAQSQGRLL